MDNRFYLHALGITGLFVVLMVVFWIASGGPASEAAIESANSTRTAIAMTGSYLLQPRTRTPGPVTAETTELPPTSLPSLTPTVFIVPSVTNTSLLSQLNTPISPVTAAVSPVAPVVSPVVPAISAVPSQTPPPVPVFTITALPGHANTKAPPRGPSVLPSATPVVLLAQTPVGQQQPEDFSRWYFTRVWNERDYQNLWDNYLTPSFKANVGSGLYEDYVIWWESVARVDVVGAEVLQNNGSDAWMRLNLTFHMKDGRVVDNQIYEYDLLYDPARNTWMFDSSP